MIITEEEAERKLNHPSNAANSLLGFNNPLIPKNPPNGDSSPINDQPVNEPAKGADESDKSSAPSFLSIPDLKSEPVPENQKDETEIRISGPGSNPQPSIPEDLKVMIGVAANLGNGNGNGKQLAEALGVSSTTISRYKNLKEEAGRKSKGKLKKEVAHKLMVENIRDIALAKTMMAMEGVSIDDLKGAKLLEKTATAKDMSIVYKNLGKDIEDAKNDGVKLIVMAPLMKSEKRYQTVEIEAKQVE